MATNKVIAVLGQLVFSHRASLVCLAHKKARASQALF
jgi:hypothetical protein